MDNASFQSDLKSDNNTKEQVSIPKDSNVTLWSSNEKSSSEQDLHTIPLDELYDRFQTDPKTGLSTDIVAEAHYYYGDNKLTPPDPPNYFLLLLKQLFSGFNSILWFAGILAFLAYKPLGDSKSSKSNLALSIVIFIVITCNSILNVYQQLKSIKIVAAFSKLLPTLATVRRDGREQQVVTDELVPGDIILIRMGDKLPADCRFIACDGLKVMHTHLSATFSLDCYSFVCLC
ncbi:hypothetical protein I4U23_003031 [Adineta vaga]|nr:hypothetical protein I4U23_003031 [Adineta vaga]